MTFPFKMHTFGTRNRGTYQLHVGLAELLIALKELPKCFPEKAANKPCTSTSFIFATTSAKSLSERFLKVVFLPELATGMEA